MIRLAALLVVLVADGAAPGRGGGLTCPKGYVGGGLTPCSLPRADFEFAPLDGAGMGVACAGTVPSGAKGEAMTFTRASVATCIKGSTTSLQPGDMVVLSAGQPRVMPGGDGTGGLGVLQEPGRTNSITQGDALDNAAWASGSSGGVPTVTADYAAGPTGATTADRLQLAPTSGNESLRYFPAGCPTGGVASASVWVRGVSGSGTLDIAINGGTGGVTCANCSYVSGAFSLCKIENATSTTVGNFLIGNASDVAGCAASRPAQDVLVSAAQCEAGPYATSYIPTAGATVSRAADQLTGGSSAGVESAGCASATLIPEWSGLNGPNESVVSAGTAGRYLYVRNATASTSVYDGTTVVGATGSFVAGSPKRMRATWSASTMTVYNLTDSTSASGAFDGSMSTGALEFGYSTWGTTGVGGVIKYVKVDRNPGGCL